MSVVKKESVLLLIVITNFVIAMIFFNVGEEKSNIYKIGEFIIFITFILISSFLYLVNEKVINSIIKIVIYVICMVLLLIYVYINEIHSVFLFIIATQIIALVINAIEKFLYFLKTD